jgi:hypothetical protein
MGVNVQIVNMTMTNGLSNERTDLRDGLVGRRHCWEFELTAETSWWVQEGNMFPSCVADQEGNMFPSCLTIIF